jgi:hypothetical protein
MKPNSKQDNQDLLPHGSRKLLKLPSFHLSLPTAWTFLILYIQQAQTYTLRTMHEGWQSDLSGTAPTLQVQSPEFKPQSHQKNHG